MIEVSSESQSNVVVGRQAAIRGGSTPALATLAAGVLSAKVVQPVITGVLLLPGTYYYVLPVSGASAIDVLLRFSAITGAAPTATIYKTLADMQTEKMGAAGASAAVAFAAFVAGTQQTASITNLRGEKAVVLRIVVGGTSCQLDQAEFSTL